MSKLNHKFFGIIDTEKDLDGGLGDIFGDGTSVLWEDEINGITVTLWYENGNEITKETLDAFEKFLKELEMYDKKFRIALEEYLKNDNYYISFHKEEMELDVPDDVSKFVEKMKVTAISLWIVEEFIHIDYVIEPDKSNEILCVKLNPDFEIDSIDWES